MKIKTILFLLFTSIIISCSPDNPNSIPIDYSKILVEQSPWELDRVEIIEIVGKNGYVFSPSEIKEITLLIKDSSYATFSFNSDGTVIWDKEGYCSNCTVPWEIVEESRIRWCPRSWCYFYDISHSNGITELIYNSKNEDGFAVEKPDGTLIRGDYLDLNSIFK